MINILIYNIDIIMAKKKVFAKKPKKSKVKPKVKPKVKQPKKAKKVKVKKEMSSTDKIVNLKLKVKELKKVYLKKRKKVATKKEYEKIKGEVNDKILKARTEKELLQLKTFLGGKAGVPSGIQPMTLKNIRPSSSVAGGTKAQKIANSFDKAWKAGNKLKNDYEKGDLKLKDVADFYDKVQQFGNVAYQAVPSWETIERNYGRVVTGGAMGIVGLRNIYNYLRSWVNNRVPSGRNPIGEPSGAGGGGDDGGGGGGGADFGGGRPPRGGGGSGG